MKTMIEYADYKAAGFSGVSEEEWPFYQRDAVYKLSYFTGISPAKIVCMLESEDVSLCICALADKMKTQQSADKNIASESADGYSVSYREQTSSSQAHELKDVCRMYLTGTGLMYCGGHG